MNFKKCFYSVISNSILLFSLISILIFSSCEVGLGESVDTENPSVEITYPPNGSVIRGAFTFAGVCADDKGVSKVFVTVRKNDDASFVKEYEAKLLDGGKWTCVLNEVQDDKSPTVLQEKVFPFADGKYEIKAVAIDSSNRQSDGISRTYEIDNTPPVFIISSPVVTDTQNATEYGSIFKISGKIADDHAPLSSMKVSVFDQDGKEISGNETWTFTKVDISGGTTVNAARYFTKSDRSPEEEILYNNYINIYGEDTEGDKVFTCTVQIEDSAKEWTEPNFDSKKEVVNKTEGNKTTKLYLNDSIYSLLMGADSEYQLEAGGIKDILNGTTKNETVLSILNERITDTKETKLAFSLNKKANPIYSISGYDVKDLNFELNSGSKNQTVTFQVQAGLNGTSVSPETFKLYLFGPFEKNSLTQEEIQKIYDEPESSAGTYGEKSLCSVIFDGNDYSKGSVATFTQAVSLPQAISSGQFYVFAASGKDLDNLDLQTSNDTVYGFQGISAGTPPKVYISEPASDGLVIKENSSLVIKGSAESAESKIASVNYQIAVYDTLKTDENGKFKKVGEISGAAVSERGFGLPNVSYSCVVKDGIVTPEEGYDSVNPKDGEIFSYTIKVTVQDDSNTESFIERNIYLDNAAPVVAITNVDPVAEKQKAENGNIVEKKINGTVTISGKVTEKNLKTFTLTIKDEKDAEIKYTLSESAFEKKIDTTLLSDGKITVSLEAIDEAENKSTIEEVYTVDQTTDKPVIKFSNGKDSSEIKNFTEVDKTKNTFGVETNNKAVFSFTDDDGLEKVTITLLDKAGKPVDASDPANAVQIQENQTEENPSPKNPVVYTFDGSTTSLVNYILPKREGRYILKVEAVDVEHKNASEKIKTYRMSETTNYIAVSDSNFNIKFTGDNIINDECSTQKVETTITGIVTVSAVEKIKSIERYEITQNAEGDWVLGSLVSSYKNDATEENPNTITIKKDSSSNYVQWTEIVPQSKMEEMKEGVKNFRYVATDITDVSVSIDLKWNVDNTLPELRKNADTENIADKWLNSPSQTLIYIVRDKESNGYASGIDSVKYSFKNGEKPTEGYFARGASCDEKGNEKADTKDWILYKTTFDLPEGKSTLVTVTVADRVGNTSFAKLNLKIDTNAPTDTTVSIVADQVLNKNKSLAITYSSKDATSGIKSIKIGTKNNLSGAVQIDGENAKDIASKVYDFALSSFADGEYKIYLQAEDVAGNKTDVIEATSAFIVDSTNPTVKITSPVADSVVNKAVTFVGTVQDSNIADSAKPVLEYSTNGTSWTAITGTTATLDGQSWTITDVDTTKIHNTTEPQVVNFRVKFTDKAANLGTSADYKLTINQNADRPEIKLTNINISASAISSNKVMGVISDDDGDVSKLYRIATSKYTDGLVPDGSNPWKEIKVEKGTGIWTAELSNDETEGEQSWYFYVIDSKNGKFCTKDSSQLNRMYLSDSLLSKTDNKKGIEFTYDITPPAIEIKAAHGTADAVENWDDKDNIFGGEQYIWIKAIVKESVEMNANPVEITVTGAAPTLKSTTTEGTTYEYTFTPVKASSLAEGTVQISVTAKDSSGLENKNMTNVIIDTTAPTVKIITPTTALSDAVSSAISVKGIIQDNYSSIKKLQWAIPKKSTQNDEHEWKDVGTAASWEIKFASGAPDSSDSLVYYANAKDAGGDDVYNISKHGTENIYKVPMYFKATDSCGNEAIIKDQYVLVDSDGGKPKAWINSPENGATTSGLVTIYGGASDNVSVSEVCIQIDANNDGNFDENDINTMSTWISQDLEAGSLFPSSGNNKNDWYIRASGTNSWKLSINSALIPTVNEKTYLRIRVRAVDDEGQTRDYSDPITVTIDSQTPTIKNLKVVQYGKNVANPTADSVPVTEREYIAGMYISDVSVATNGKWFLVGDIHDNESIATVSFTKLESTTTNTINLNVQDQHPNEGDYKLQIPLVTNQSGVISYAIKAIDENHAETTSNITINIDSSAPSLYTTNNSESLNVGDKLRLKSVGKVIGTGDANGTVVNNNNFFTFGDVVSEGGSGLAHLAFYFERNGSSERRIYNPMLEVSNPDNKTVISSKAAINGSKYINDDGLAVMYVTDNLRDSDDAITISSANPNVRKGGLIKIAGGYSQITEVNGTTVKFSPTASTSFTTAEIVLAQVVDHQIIESLGDDNSVMNDDGDEMVETIQLIGSSYNWTASVDSTNIPDGPITIHVVAIDNAGNISRGSIATRVENNRPRIAKVLLATDLNDNGYYDWNANSAPVTTGDDEKDTKDGKAFGEFSYYSALNPNSGKAQSEVTLNSSAFKVIDGLCIIPEFVGGNTELRYILEYPANLATATKKTGAVTAMTTTSDISDKTKNVGEYSITDQISSFGGIVLNSITSGNISITFWDKTEETTQGTNSQWALLKIPVTNLESDPEKPEAKIAPFYWNSSTDNSVYINGGIKGHIELENDLPNDTFKAANVSGVYDRDPKVSGKIKLEGIVYDNVRLKNITFNGTAAGNVVGTYAGGKWTAAGSLPTGVKSFAAEDIELSQNGHYVKYEMVIDTETLNPSSPIVSDKGITVGAIDWRSNVSATSSTKTTGTTQEINGDTYNTGTTNYYRMDLVPYVTEVWTSLSEYDRNNSSVYSRSSIGKYPVRVGENITVYGWNLSNDCSVTLGGNPVTGVTCELKNNLDVKQGTYGINMTITEEHSSGALEVTVNGISALNNKNNNQAKGKYAGDISDKDATDKEYAHGYNRRPNGINNNVLTDDIALDVWDFKVAAQPEGSSAKYVHMKVGPYLPGNANNARIGFSFKNGIGYYNMAGNACDVSGELTLYEVTKKQVDIYVESSLGYNAIYYWNGGTSKPSSPQTMGNTVSYNGGTYYKYSFDESDITVDSNGYVNLKIILTKAVGAWTDQTGNITLDLVGEYIITSGTSLPAKDNNKTISPNTEYRVAKGTSSVSAPTVFSHTRMGSNFGGFTSNSFTFDSKGQTYGVAMCPDTSGKAGIAANLQFFSRATGSNNTSDSQDLDYNYLNVNNARRIENICYYKDGNLKTDEERIQVPSMVSYVSGETSYVYLAYYDHGLDQVKFRIGSVGSTANDIGLGLQDLNKLTTGLGGSKDDGKIGVACDVFDSTSSSYVGDKGNAYKNVKVISSGNEASADVAVASLNDGTAVVAYYTGKELKIQYAPFDSIDNNEAVDATWITKSVSTKGGKNVAMVADAAGGLHFAYSSNSGADLYYTYMSSLTATPVTMLVDSYDNVGSYCTIDVGRTSSTSSQWIPYITYKRDASEVALKMAYPIVNVSTEKPGASSAGFFTGNWDICTIPSANNSTNDLVNVGLCKDWGNGVIQNFPTGADDFTYNPGGTYTICNSSVIYGNGTQNPVVGYAVEQGYIEVAQKK